MMKKTLIATLMAVIFGLFSMPALQAAPSNGWAVGSGLKADSLVQDVRRRRRRARRRRRRRRFCAPVHYRRSRVRQRCRWRWF